MEKKNILETIDENVSDFISSVPFLERLNIDLIIVEMFIFAFLVVLTGVIVKGVILVFRLFKYYNRTPDVDGFEYFHVKPVLENDSYRIISVKEELHQKFFALAMIENNRKISVDTEDSIEVAKIKKRIMCLREGLKRGSDIHGNPKSGYVYVISNKRTFKEDIVKIGMTKKEDPYSRIKSLYSTSVPHPFEQCFIYYTEDALKEEKRLHNKFNKKRITQKREFFKVAPEKVLMSLEKNSGIIVAIDKGVLCKNGEVYQKYRKSFRRFIQNPK